ncbi:hypothetical protein P3S68_028986 [Capsicum galapagoense]
MMKLEENKKPAQKHPWLAIRHGYGEQKYTFYDVSEKRCYERSIPELQNKIIHRYAHEWFVLEEVNSNDCYLWSPVSNDKIQLPLIPEYCRVTSCLLSAPPHDPECLVLFLIEEEINDDMNDNSDDDTLDENAAADDDRDSENSDDHKDVNKLPALLFCKPGYDHEFHKQDLQSIIGDNVSVKQWTVFKKKFYLLTFETNILLRLDPDNDLGTITATRMTNQPPDVRTNFELVWSQSYLIPSSCDDNDMLLYVHKDSNGKLDALMPYDFLVLRFDFVQRVWVKMESIGEIAIFLSDYSLTTCSTRGRSDVNKGFIYFTQGRYLYTFNMEISGISVSLPCQRVSNRNALTYWLTFPF